MIIYCICIFRGAFGDAAINDLYPKLLKRLDDSNDTVRIAVANTLEMFLQSGPKHCYSSTMIGYTLDMLFIHLDDMNPVIQDCIYKVILTCSALDKPLCVKKAENAKLASRNPQYCNKIISILTDGYEIIDNC